MPLQIANTSPDKFLTRLHVSVLPGTSGAARQKVVVKSADIHPRQIAPGQSAVVAVTLALDPPSAAAGAGCPPSFKLALSGRLGAADDAEEVSAESQAMSVRCRAAEGQSFLITFRDHDASVGCAAVVTLDP